MHHSTSTTARLDQAVSRILLRLGGLAVIAVLVAVGFNLWRDAISSRVETDVTASQALAAAHTGMLDMETGLRGYLAAGEAQFLQPYNDGSAAVAANDQALQNILASDPQTLNGYLSVRIAQNAWERQWADVASRPWQGPPTAAFLASGKQLFDSYRGTESALSSALDARIDQSEQALTVVGFSGLAVEIAIALIGSVLWFRSGRRLRRDLVGPITSILVTLDRLEAGDYSAPQQADRGPAELREITRRLASIATALQSANEGVARREQDAAAHANRLRGIVDMGREIAGSLNLHYVLQAVAHSVAGFGCGTRCIIWLTDDANGTLVPMHDSAGLKGRVVGLDPLPLTDQAVGRAARYGRVVGPEPVTHPDVLEPWSHALAVPMIVGARVVGVIEIGSSSAEAPSNEMLELINTLSSQAATAIEAARLYERAEHESRTDPLTLLPNRHDLDTTLANEVVRAERYGRPLAVAMVDLDHFKAVNDTFGHARGDDVLQHAAAVMKGTLRAIDSIYRYGGEEFLLVMPETDRDSAVELCERLRVAVSTHVTLPDGRRLTMSAGVASFPDHALTPAALVSAADRALYRAKADGRDRVLAGEGRTVQSGTAGVVRMPAPTPA